MLGKSLYKLLAKQCNLRKIIIDTTKLMKNSINISNNVDLIFNTYTFLFFKLLLRILMLLDSFHSTMQDESARQRGW